MLQTIQSKSEASSQIQVAKEKDPGTAALAGGLHTFFAQFMAVMPPQQQPAPVFKTMESSTRSTRNDAPGRPAQESTRPGLETERPANQGDASALDSAGEARKTLAAAEAKAAKAKAAETKAAESKAAETKLDATTDPSAGAPSEAPQPAKTGTQAATNPAESQPQHQANPQLQATQEPGTPSSSSASTPSATGASTSAAAAAKPASPEAISAAKAQAALEQLLPGSRVNFQFGEQTAQPTSKPALSEFMQQLKVEIQSPVFAGAATATESPLGQAASTPPAVLATLPALLAASEAAQLSLGHPTKEGSAGAPSGAGTIYPAEAVGAGAAQGAHGAVRVTAPSASDQALAARRDTPMAQVDSSVRWLIKNKEQSAELQLHPEALGRVQIKLTVEGTEVHAKLWASEAGALPVLQEHRALLEASLKAQGLTLGSFDLQQGHQSDQAPLPTPEPAFQPLGRSAVLEATEQELPTLQATSHAGGHRIEIVA